MELADFPLADQYDEANYSQTPLGPSSKSCCRVLNSGSCGSGSIVGLRDGKTIVLTNAHVAGTKIGHTVVCQFPYDNNKKYNARVIMAGYSDTVMMDWAILEIDAQVPLPPVKLSIEAPSGEHYTMGYPRCEGPYSQKLITRQITHNGTVWRWQPISIGGQSGSAVHSFKDNFQRGLLTWSWSGDGAGQTTRSIWFQYVNRAVVGFPRPDGLVDLAKNRAEFLEEGFFQEANITTLPIWAHLDNSPPGDPPPGGSCDELRAQVLKIAEGMQQQVGKLIEAVRATPGTTPQPDSEPNTGGTFGL